jgi:hypothetical protein
MTDVLRELNQTHAPLHTSHKLADRMITHVTARPNHRIDTLPFSDQAEGKEVKSNGRTDRQHNRFYSSADIIHNSVYPREESSAPRSPIMQPIYAEANGSVSDAITQQQLNLTGQLDHNSASHVGEAYIRQLSPMNRTENNHLRHSNVHHHQPAAKPSNYSHQPAAKPSNYSHQPAAKPSNYSQDVTTSPAVVENCATQSPSMAYAKAFRAKVLLSLGQRRKSPVPRAPDYPEPMRDVSSEILRQPLNVHNNLRQSSAVHQPSDRRDRSSSANAGNSANMALNQTPSLNHVHHHHRQLQHQQQHQQQQTTTSDEFAKCLDRDPTPLFQLPLPQNDLASSAPVPELGEPMQRLLPPFSPTQNQPPHKAATIVDRERVAPLIAARAHQLQLAVLETAPLHERSAAEANVLTPRPSSPVSLETHRFIESLNPNLRVLLDEDIQQLKAATVEYAKLCADFDAKVQAMSPASVKAASASALIPVKFHPDDKSEAGVHLEQTGLQSTLSMSNISSRTNREFELEPDDPDIQRKKTLLVICDMLSSREASDNMDGLLLLGVFFDENKDQLNWDGLLVLFLQILNFVPSNTSTLKNTILPANVAIVRDAACFCISEICQNSALILLHAQQLDVVPRVLDLIMCAVYS